MSHLRVEHLCGNTRVTIFFCVVWHVSLMHVVYCLGMEVCPVADGLENTLHLLKAVLDRVESEAAVVTVARPLLWILRLTRTYN